MAAVPLTIINERTQFPRVTLIPPTQSGYIHLAVAIDGRSPLLPDSRRKRRLIARCKGWCRQLAADPRVVSAVTFEALLIPPGRGAFLRHHPGSVHIARFDLAILIETVSVAVLEAVMATPAFAALAHAVRSAATFIHTITATNTRRIGPVDRDNNAVFLFNYFFAADTGQNLAVWEYTAGWFMQETGLDNSTVLVPRDGVRSEYTILNYCGWPRLRDVLPALLFTRSFRTYVLANFAANRVAAMPILYRRA